MAVYTIQATFGRGELTPKLHSRADLDLWKMGLKTCLNFTVLRQGGAARRPGTQYIDAVRNQDRPARLIPFIYNSGPNAQAYVLVLNDGVFRAYALGGRVGGVEVAHPYADADLFQIDYDQTNDVLDLAHKGYAPRRIARLSDTSWSINTVQFRFGPYLPVNVTATSLTPSATGNAIPQMTGNTAPSGTAAASSVNTYPAWGAFDRDGTTTWTAASKATEWLSYTFPVAKIITGYSVQCGTGAIGGDLYTNRAPRTWTFEGFDGTNWIVLDSQFGQGSWSDNEIRFFRFINPTAYIGYRINVSSNNGGAYIAIAEMAFTEDTNTAPPVTLTASSTTGINGGAGFSSSDVGRIIAVLGSNAVYRAFVITAVVSSTVVQAKLDDAPLPTVQSTLQWRLGAWGVTPGWPAHVCTFEGRKIYARTNAQPSGLWGTKSGGYGTMLDFSTTVPVQDDDAISFTLTDVNEIQWIAEGPDLLIGTAGAARTMGRDSPNLPFSANNYRQSLASTYASNPVRPTKIGGSTVFVSTFGKALREFVQADNGVGYDTPDISLLSEHLLASGVTELSYAQEPDSVIWAPNGKGDLIGFTYEKAQAMTGLHRHQLGGGGFVESCCTIPGAGRNEVWMVVRRTINGATRRTIERMAASFDAETASPASAWYVDCGLQYSGAPATSVSGLAHLEGQTVSILADGARETDQVVTGGAVSLASGRAAGTITVGLPYGAQLRTLPSPVSQGDGSGLGRRKKIVSATLDLLNSGPVKVGRDASCAEPLVFRDTIDTLGAAPPLETGMHVVRPEGKWSDGGEISVFVDGPQPCIIRSITLALEPEP